MSTEELSPLSPNASFSFDCHPGLACFNQCCRDLNQALTPYDTLRLRAYLEISTAAFRDKYLEIRPGPGSGLPVATLRFSDHPQKLCPFVRAEGCLVYPARPASCRMYPLARALHRSRADGRLREHFALLREPHCLGFEQNRDRTVRQWIINQELGIHLRINDALLELIALKNRLRPGHLSPDHWHWASMVFYDLDGFKSKVLSDDPATTSRSDLANPPEAGAGDELWLEWAMQWLRVLLFGRF